EERTGRLRAGGRACLRVFRPPWLDLPGLRDGQGSLVGEEEAGSRLGHLRRRQPLLQRGGLRHRGPGGSVAEAEVEGKGTIRHSPTRQEGVEGPALDAPRDRRRPPLPARPGVPVLLQDQVMAISSRASLGRAALEKLQAERLRSLLDEVLPNNPFYARKFA